MWINKTNSKPNYERYVTKRPEQESHKVKNEHHRLYRPFPEYFYTLRFTFV